MMGANIMLPQNMLSIRFDDGQMGFLDASDGTYYDNQGNDITGFVQNFGGVTVLGPASAASIAAAEGIPAPVTVAPGLPPGPAPRISTTPAAPSSLTSAMNWFTGSNLISGIPNLAVIGGGLLALTLVMGSGGRRRR